MSPPRADRTGSVWCSAFVAALFAIHPLHVESVAWVAERKDVLSGVFFMLTLAAYLRYVRRPSRANYLSVALVFGLGLMSKPMLVTLPFVLLLLDYWPLKRFASSGSFVPVLLDKLPFFGLTVIGCLLTFAATDGIHPARRIQNIGGTRAGAPRRGCRGAAS